MAKKIRFPLEMESGVEVRSLEELKNNFSLSKVLIYIANGKMATWLCDRYENALAESVNALDLDSPTLSKEICALFDVAYDEEAITDLEQAMERNRRLDILKSYTSDQTYIKAIDQVAFSQDDLYDLLDEDTETIYLLGERFSIPLGKEGVTYKGINTPTLVINAKDVVDWQKINITLTGIKYDEAYQEILEDDKTKKEALKDTKPSLKVVNHILDEGDYTKSYLNFMLSPTDKVAAKETFEHLYDHLINLHYDRDKDIDDIKSKLLEAGISGLAENYLNSL